MALATGPASRSARAPDAALSRVDERFHEAVADLVLAEDVALEVERLLSLSRSAPAWPRRCRRPSRRSVTTFPHDTSAEAMRQSAREKDGRGPSRAGRGLEVLISDGSVRWLWLHANGELVWSGEAHGVRCLLVQTLSTSVDHFARASARVLPALCAASAPIVSSMLPIDLSGRRALVAGIADDNGFGFAIAKALAEAGATVCAATWPPALNIFRTLHRAGQDR